MNAVEWIGVISGVAAVYLLYRNHISTWPVGFINIGCFMWMFWNEKLYGDFIVQIIFLSMGVWGWFHWNRHEIKRPGKLSAKQRFMWIALTGLTIPITALYFKNYTNCSYPWVEAAILNISISGQWLTAIRKVENWYFWLFADFLMIIIYQLKGLYLTSVYAGIIFVIGIFGLLSWHKLMDSVNEKTPVN